MVLERDERLPVQRRDPGRDRLRATGRRHRRRTWPRSPARSQRVRRRRRRRPRRRRPAARRRTARRCRSSCPIDAGDGGWETLGATVDEHPRRSPTTRRTACRCTSPARAASPPTPRRRSRASTARCCTPRSAVVVVILLLTYRSPVLWLLPVFSAGVALFVAQAVIYLLADAGRPDRERAERGHPDRAGVRRRDRLRAAAGRPLPGGAPPPRGPARGDGVRAAPLPGRRSWPAASTVIAGMLCLLARRDELRPRASARWPRSASRSALLAMLTLLPALLVIVGRWVFWPVRPTFGSADHTETGVWARRRPARSPAARARSGWPPRSSSRSRRSASSQLDANGLQNKDAFYGTPDSVVGEEVLAEHFPAGAGQPVVVVSDADEAAAVRTALAGTDGIDDGHRAGGQGRPRVPGGHPRPTRRTARPRRTPSTGSATRCTRSPARTRMVGGGTAIVLDTLRASSRGQQADHPDRAASSSS